MNSEFILKSYESSATLHLRDVVSVQQDLHTADKYLAQISIDVREDQKQQIINQALWTSARVTFFKYFSSGVRKYKLDKNIFSSLPGDPLGFYKYLKNVRDRHLAHSISTLEETIVGPILDPRHERRIGIAQLSARFVMDSDEALANFRKLVCLVMNEVKVELVHANEIVESELNQFSYEEMLKWKALNYTVPKQGTAAYKSRTQSTRQIHES